MATVVIDRKGDWAVVSSDGRFDKSSKFEGLHWVRRREILELDQFFDEFYTPGLFAHVLQQGTERIDRSVEEAVNQSPPPKVEILFTKEDGKVTKKEFEFAIKVTDSGGGIDEIKLLHNGKRVSGYSGLFVQ